MKNFFLILITICFLSCNNRETYKEKGFQVSEELEETDSLNVSNAIKKDSLDFKTKSVGVLLTGNVNTRISPIFKINYNKKRKQQFTGSSEFHYNYNEEFQSKGNRWENIIPGFEALYGYNLVNIYQFNHNLNIGKKLFKKPVLIKTCYYPSYIKDTLNYKPVNRNFYMVSVYDEDTNKDKYINLKDLRRFYLFDENGEKMEEIVPKNFSVIAAQYDPANDYLYIHTKKDINNDGKISKNEPVTIFYLDLKDPVKKGLFYEN